MVLILHPDPCQPAQCCPTVTLVPSHWHWSSYPIPGAGGGGGRGQPLCRRPFIFRVGGKCHPAVSSFTWKFCLFFNCLLKALYMNFLSPAHLIFFHLPFLIWNKQILCEDKMLLPWTQLKHLTVLWWALHNTTLSFLSPLPLSPLSCDPSASHMHSPLLSLHRIRVHPLSSPLYHCNIYRKKKKTTQYNSSLTTERISLSEVFCGG